MPKLPRWTAFEAERALLHAGFEYLWSKGSHRIYGKGNLRLQYRSTAAWRSIQRLSSRYAKSLTTLADAGITPRVSIRALEPVLSRRSTRPARLLENKRFSLPKITVAPAGWRLYNNRHLLYS
jgi:predicted RNA binding protein YcfA (HicA-like mRNA interferase family)